MDAPQIYLTFPGTAEAAITYYAEVFGSEVAMFQRMSEIPDFEVPQEAKNLVMHARVSIGGRDLMVSDSHESFAGPHPGFGGFSVQIGCGTPEEAERLFAALSDGGRVTMALGQTFWARAFGSCVDKFGVPWMVNCE